MPISSFFIKVLSILTILIRDFRFVLPYFSQFFLLASPIFYLPRQPNTFFEIIWSKINILEMLITSYRESNIIYQTQLGFLFVFIFFVFLNSIMNRVMLRTYLSFSESSNLEEE
jgi:ABC-type polysaccharide/polyol phosphate export permease